MHHLWISWHIIPLRFSSWNIICFGQKELIKLQFFRLLNALMKFHPIHHAIVETTRSRFIQILHHCSVSWMITPLYFFLAPTLYALDKKEFSDFWVVGWKFIKCLMSCLKLQVCFSLNLASLFSFLRDNSSVLFLAETVCDLDKRSPSKWKISDFRLLTWNFTKCVIW